ncbi:hypothetical protein E4631_10295 [Hymenobacter sp. UV11]|uniref:hypothetical protein n=1 Tax=Hymenobacter sp. UV11 TaxID=1849735 RepID=UPI00105EC1C5|nr:hypothetical protein [Hymenobacter sp. UV11]TDN40581.1 hypothetical protein A8B98_14255 [Hymenobacter sp. UV11]TFZ66402.1 hypothetical protein E4631_10295 [Hymenobacter sp. UV11]
METTILPAGQVTAVLTTAASGQMYSVAPDANTKTFWFTTLPAVIYVLSTTTTTVYKTPVPVQVAVTAGATTAPQLSPLTQDCTLRGVGGQEYPFASYTYTPGQDMWKYFKPYTGGATGKGTITRHDTKAFAIAGTFEFEAQPFSTPTGAPER